MATRRSYIDLQNQDRRNFVKWTLGIGAALGLKYHRVRVYPGALSCRTPPSVAAPPVPAATAFSTTSIICTTCTISISIAITGGLPVML